MFISFSFKRFYLFIFRERGRGAEREGEKHQCVVASPMTPTGGLTHNPGMCPDWELNWRPFGLQAGTQSTEPHQPGLISYLPCVKYVVTKVGSGMPLSSRSSLTGAGDRWMGDLPRKVGLGFHRGKADSLRCLFHRIPLNSGQGHLAKRLLS